MNNITVIGAGTMGNGIAHVCAQAGYAVILTDVNADALISALKTIEKNLDRMVQKGLLTSEQKQETLNRISTATDLKSAVINADLIIEAATENESIKLNIFQELSNHAKKEAILASNTSSISITKIASVCTHPERVIGMHFMNPVPVMKLVEIIRGYSTSASVLKQITDLSVDLGKIPVEVADYPGFVSNRILMSMINESIYTLYEGEAGVEEIDSIMKLGMAHPMGPLQLADFIGLDVCYAILKVLQNGFGNQKYAPCPLLVNMVAARKLGVKSLEGFYTYGEDKKIKEVSQQFKK